MSAVIMPQRSGRGLPLEQRKRLAAIGLVLAYVLVLGIGVGYNVVFSIEHRELKQQIAGHQQELSLTERIRTGVRTEQVRRDELRRRGDGLLAQFPDMAAVPVIVGQLEEIVVAVGGEVTDVQYVAPVWDGDHGEVWLQLEVTGGFDAIAKYLESVAVSVPTLHWDSFNIQPKDVSDQALLLSANVRLDLLQRQAETEGQWRDDQVRLVARTAAVSPFGALVRIKPAEDRAP